MSEPIPQPPGIPLLGNVTDVDPQNAIKNLMHLAEKYGPIFKLTIFGWDRYFIASAELLNEVCDETRFCKSVSGPLAEVRHGVGDGLFTARHGEHNWEVAHRTLIPAFGPIGIQHMYDEMYDIATQLVAKWARMEGQQINVVDDFTRLALDTIALCAMDMRFNSFYKEELHPFINAMSGFLTESGRRPARTRLEQFIYRGPQKKFEEDIALMRKVAGEVTAHRRANPSDKKDLLNALLFGKDPKTGERLSDESIMNNMITFLIAGHETTSGMLSFTFYFLLKHPNAFRKAQQEVDKVVGKGPVTFQHLTKLPYIEAVLRETLRLEPSAPALTMRSIDKTSGPVTIGGKYLIPPKAPIICLLPAIGRDPAAFGADAEEFRPERMYGENFTKIPKNAWKPFGNGVRGCIGRPFAWQEAILTMALILQNFNIRMDDHSYNLQIKQTLTIKPDNFFMRATLREGIDPVQLEKKMFAGLENHETTGRRRRSSSGKLSKRPMTILYGSNSGTCEGLSQTLAHNAVDHGFSTTVMPLDNAANHLPENQPIVIITASYEGNPPDNAAGFVDWLTNLEPSTLRKREFAVFGCGHHDWVSTFQKIPKLIDNEFEERGAIRITSRGESDVGAGTVFDDFDEWQDTQLWPALSDGAKRSPSAFEGLDMKISTTVRSSHLRHNVQNAVVVTNEKLSGEGVPEKRHTEFKLPTNLTYDTGDYLALLPHNNIQTISRILRRFALPWDAVMTLKEGAHTTIPTGKELEISSVLGAYVELNTLASRKNLATIAKYATDDETKERLIGEKGIPGGSTPLIDVVEEHAKIDLPFPVFLSMLPPMRIRQYSISSSPLNDPTKVSITYSIVDDQRGHLGVATNYLKQLQPGTSAQLTIKKSPPSFHLPLDDKTPIIMVCAGTGLAPFRGFVQERAAKISAAASSGKQTDLGEAILFVGCRDPDRDRLYSDEVDEWEKLGAVKVFYAFSRATDKSEGCKYVQDRLWHERETASRLFDNGAKAFICGTNQLGKGVSEVVARIAVENAKNRGEEATLEGGMKWWEGLRGERYAVDVFD